MIFLPSRLCLRASSMIKLNKNQPDANSFKNHKILFHSTLLNMFRVSHAEAAVTTEEGWRTQPKLHHTVTRGCMCSSGKLLMMDTVVSKTC
jgi:hypothetical protein